VEKPLLLRIVLRCVFLCCVPVCGTLLCCVALRCIPVFALDEQSELNRLSDIHQMFLLRDAVSRHPQTSDFYSGEVACAFNHTAACEEKFKRILAAEPNSPAAKRIHHILAYAALREGRYARALREMDALLALDPQDGDAKDTRPFVEGLSHFPDQAVEVSSATRATIPMGDGKLPLLINGKKASYFIDTGANLSTLSQSEVLRLGMEMRDVKSEGGSTDVNGSRVLFQIALAKRLSVGGIVLNNVAFLVTSNQQPPFADMEPGERGLIGLPVLLALRSVKWGREGTFEADRSPKLDNITAANAPAPKMAAANLCFDDLMLITAATFEQHQLPFVLDTGAVTTDLWPKFAGVAGELIRKSGSHEARTVTGMGGEQTFEAISIPKVILRVGGEAVVLQPAHVLQVQQRSVGERFYGNLGIDLLGQAKTVSFDFRTMRLRLYGVAEPARAK
jgi:hypothetical protein